MTIKSSFHSSIPVVDFRDLLSSDQKKKEAFRVKIGQAMHTLGFVAVVNTDLDSERLDKTYQVAKRFFDQTLAVKEIVTSRGNSGERGFVHVESPKEGGVAARDRKEFFHVGPEFAEKERKERGYYANVWPEDPEFKRTIRDLYECLISYIRPLATAISTKEEDLSSLVDRGEHLLRLIHYPGKMSPKEEWAA
ncbi:MAG: hypothetical protein FJZ64_02730, partial [Chlamydiae bacterium]|nr:hypothetical protein [Chlamydiota bacterium]